jgi:hypothetical protein
MNLFHKILNGVFSLFQFNFQKVCICDLLTNCNIFNNLLLFSVRKMSYVSAKGFCSNKRFRAPDPPSLSARPKESANKDVGVGTHKLVRTQLIILTFQFRTTKLHLLPARVTRPNQRRKQLKSRVHQCLRPCHQWFVFDVQLFNEYLFLATAKFAIKQGFFCVSTSTSKGLFATYTHVIALICSRSKTRRRAEVLQCPRLCQQRFVFNLQM